MNQGSRTPLQDEGDQAYAGSGEGDCSHVEGAGSLPTTSVQDLKNLLRLSMVSSLIDAAEA